MIEKIVALVILIIEFALIFNLYLAYSEPKEKEGEKDGLEEKTDK